MEKGRRKINKKPPRKRRRNVQVNTKVETVYKEDSIKADSK